jgi:ribonuclease III
LRLLDIDPRARFGDRLGHRFADPDLLTLALTHRSWCAENPGEQSNERLEFLGDAVLGMVVTEYLFVHFPSMPEGELAKARASVVSSGPLANAAASLELGAALRLGKGEDASGGREKPSILADAMEAVLGAVYLDGGYEPVERLVLRLFEHRIEQAAALPGERDFKTQLQELSARLFDELPAYEVRDEGPDHKKLFHATVRLGGVLKGEGQGRSKKQAEQAAAEAAWRRLSLAPPGAHAERREAAGA